MRMQSTEVCDRGMWREREGERGREGEREREREGELAARGALMLEIPLMTLRRKLIFRGYF